MVAAWTRALRAPMERYRILKPIRSALCTHFAVSLGIWNGCPYCIEETVQQPHQTASG